MLLTYCSCFPFFVRWMHVCLAYEKKTGFTRVIRVGLKFLKNFLIQYYIDKLFL